MNFNTLCKENSQSSNSFGHYKSMHLHSETLRVPNWVIQMKKEAIKECKYASLSPQTIVPLSQEHDIEEGVHDLCWQILTPTPDEAAAPTLPEKIVTDASVENYPIDSFRI